MGHPWPQPFEFGFQYGIMANYSIQIILQRTMTKTQLLLTTLGFTLFTSTGFAQFFTTPAVDNTVSQDIQNGVGTVVMNAIISKQMAETQTREQQITNERMEQASSEKSQIMLLYSQNTPPIFLGCLTCGAISPYSTSNANSPYGNQTGKLSIFNSKGIYGSNTSNFSPCNPNAEYPPVIMNGLGVKYGLLTLNTKLFGAITDPTILNSLKTHVCINNRVA